MFFVRILKVPLINSSVRCFHLSRSPLWNGSKQIEHDVNYFYDTKNLAEISQNISNRKGIGNIQLVHELNNKLKTLHQESNDFKIVESNLNSELLKIPNRTHPEVAQYGNAPKLVKLVGEKPKFSSEPLQFQEITKRMKLIRTDQLGSLSGSKSYYILGELAELEQAIIKYIVAKLLQNNFQLISVPDILHRNIIEACGMSTKGKRTQIYTLDPDLHGPDLCLSGTSEMALAGFLANKHLDITQLPLKLAAVSRCYRAETSNLIEERGIYRVHEFTKVEMFAVAPPEQSDGMLEDILAIQEECFQSLGLHFQVLDMPPHELGAPAYRKYDIEAWLSGRKLYGEISSCSNCTDYQSRRLGIRYKTGDGSLKFVHTLNGTACAIPRLLIALVEQGQSPKGWIEIPQVLQPFMNGKVAIHKQKTVPDLKLVKNKK